ncbi:monovalent cation/H+ antiporter subunit D family protein [Desulfosporosinus sp.]|uniref:monovalent cation/H+ antiporter subunit D family protein n=1 Tax=Desulfosporosinus sp. TaxID=157907 RepID=UPI0025BFA238|nr:monovalent cation/H+ antiporter subunit D family protein [Desulfosporosinus sp.]MBC2721957.1 monovalent cation/H+ antiporter subunit D family protein [Desulfosporosinus sp.]MBC2728438.1 monovalent cation/H+ antiporter subunit D family protein [Desulfosporosinus sp.]
MIKHLPALLIVIPLLAAIITPIIGRIHWVLSWYTVTITTFISFVISLSLLQTVLLQGDISYWMGGWQPPWGIEYAIDNLNVFVMIIVSFMAFAGAIYSKNSINDEIDEARKPFFYSVYLLFVTGLMGMVVTGDIFNIYVFLEITALAGYALIAIGKKRQALLGAYNYLVMGTIGATFFLLGIGYLYLMTGTLNIADMAARLPEFYQTKAIFTAFTFLVIGLCIKLALFPMHFWMPNVYTHAPSAVSAVMAATGAKVAAYAIIRVMFTVFEPEFYTLAPFNIQPILLILAVAAILAGSIMALAQTDIKKMLAYSSVGQVGYIVLGISLMSVNGMIGSLIHLLNHAMMKGALFFVVGAVVYRTGLTSIENFRGLGKKMPLSMAAFTIAALSMTGVPLTVGFVSKWYLAVASIEIGMWWLVPVILLSSLLTAIYFWRIIDAVWFKPALGEESHGHEHDDHQKPKSNDAPASMLIPTLTVAMLCLVFGVFAYAPVSLAEKAAVILLK